MKRYLVKLTPHDRFFFGGESTFGEGNSRNYFVKSNYYPQQTTLLGLVRYQLMVQNSKGVFEQNKIRDHNKATELINNKSFEITDASFSFGKIKALSPIFIAHKNDEYLFPANREFQWDKEENKFVMREFKKESNANRSIYLNKDFIPFLENYNAKDGLPDLLLSNKNNLYQYPEIFIEHKQIGIRKNYKGNSEDNAFYVQYFYKLKKGYSFAFILELEDDIKFETEELVTIGGEQSKFRMEVTEKDIEFKKILPDYEKSRNSDKIVLVSDAFVSNEIFNDCTFAVTETIDFRSLRSTINTTNYSKLDQHSGVSKSNKYNLFKKGSVFYGEDANKIIKHFDDKIAAKSIGYNHYKIVNKKGS